MNEYGYNLPMLDTKRFKTLRVLHNSKHMTSPRTHKFLNHSVDADSLNSSYMREEYKSTIVKFGAWSQTGYNPMNPLKTNQDSYIVADTKL